jgi:hypothetical protein
MGVTDGILVRSFGPSAPRGETKVILSLMRAFADEGCRTRRLSQMKEGPGPAVKNGLKEWAIFPGRASSCLD